MSDIIKMLSDLDLSKSALIGCEESGVVRRAFTSRGIDTWSNDLLPASDGSNKHLQCNLIDLLGLGWGFLAVMHPPCTVLCNSGVKHLYIGGRAENGRNEARWAELEEAAAFYRSCRDAPISRIAIENPVMHGHAIRLTRRGKTHFVHPYFFGEPFFKMTGFETLNLPPLVATNKLTPPNPGTAEHKAWSACHRAAPGPNRARERSRTYDGVANAMADQWGRFIDSEAQI